MSAEDVSKFEEKVTKDPQLLAELQSAAGSGDASEKIAGIARSHGFSISASEVDDHLKKMTKSSELTDEALSGVAGGSWTYSRPGCDM